jgi:hypothetical protein
MKIINKFMLTIVLCVVSINSFASVVIDKTKSHDGDVSGYIEDTQVYFSVIDGQSLKPTREMQRIVLEFSDKTITIQRSDNEFYVKGQNKEGQIILLSPEDYTLVQQATANLFKNNDGNVESEDVINRLGTTLNLLASWPANMPLLIWQDQKSEVSAVDSDNVISRKKSSKKVDGLDKSLLDNNDNLQFPEIVPFKKEGNGKGTVSKSSALKIGKSSDWNNSVSLCSSIGQRYTGKYPVIITTDPAGLSNDAALLKKYMGMPEGRVITTDNPVSYTIAVGGDQCLGRCGAGCTDVIAIGGIGNPTNSNVYSQDCADHDRCADDNGIAHPYCNAIFAHAADDFVGMASCQHDLEVKNYFVSNGTTKVTSQSSKLKKTDNLNIVYEFGNSGNANLPHGNGISLEFAVDGVVKGRNSISGLNQKGVRPYYFNIGQLSTGAHNISIQVLNSNIIESSSSARANNFVMRFFTIY